MASDYLLNKAFSSFKGLDLRSSDLLRDSEFASAMKNAQYRATGAISKRFGYKAVDSAHGGVGLSKYSDLNITTGAITEKLVSIDENLHLLETHNLTITYSGSANTVYTSIFFSSTDNQYKIEIYEDTSLTYEFLLGTGRDEGAPIALSGLVSGINALTDFSASVSGLDTVSCALLEMQSNLEITTSGTDIPYQYYTQVDCPITNPFATHYAKRNELEFENATTANFHGVMYISNGITDLYKYDGVRVYKAGLSTPVTPSSALQAGALSGTYQYQVTYEYTDAKGNFIESIPSESIEVTPAGNSVDITYNNLQSSSGFDVDSTDLKVSIWRTEDTGSTFKLVTTIVNDKNNATSVYNDTTVDGSLGAIYIVPIKEHGLPPKGKYISFFRNQLVITGKIDDVNNVFYSDIDSPEYFPEGQNAFLVETNIGDKVTGIAPLRDSLYIFKDNSIHALTGEIEADLFRVDLITKGKIGCKAHATIQEVSGSLFFLSSNGIYALSSRDTEPEHVGALIEPRFKETQSNFKASTAVNWIQQEQYILILPKQSLEGTDRYTSESNVFVYDYYRDAWLQWDNLDLTGGTDIVNGKLYFTERRYSTFSSSVTNYTYQIQNRGDTFDYVDHDESIELEYKTNWEALGGISGNGTPIQEPSVFKKFLRLKIHSLDASVNDFETQSFVLDVDCETDYVTSPSSQLSYDFGQGNLGWGNSAWGSFPWGNTRIKALVRKLKKTKARSLRLVLKNDEINTNILITGYEMEIAVPFASRIKE